MNQLAKNYLSYVLLLFMYCGFSQVEQKFANIGDFTTSDGEIIKDCKIGYRTVGELNAEKSNAILWPTWFTGTSEQVVGILNTTIDTTGLYIIIADALTNGVSASPSNTNNFPKITIRDMVNSQHQLLTNHLGIDHLKAVVGISMGGMQTFEWLVAFPEFMDKAISIIGSPKQSSQDLLIWETMADIITHAKQEGEDLDLALKRAANIELINLLTPAYVAKTYPADSVGVYRKTYGFVMKPLDVLGGLNAMIPHDIYKNANTTPEDISAVIKAEVMVVIATQDHLVNPISAITLAEKLNAQLVTLEGDCGHLAAFCEAGKVKQSIDSFLK